MPPTSDFKAIKNLPAGRALQFPIDVNFDVLLSRVDGRTIKRDPICGDKYEETSGSDIEQLAFEIRSLRPKPKIYAPDNTPV
jgi:hypothetical protein